MLDIGGLFDINWTISAGFRSAFYFYKKYRSHQKNENIFFDSCEAWVTHCIFSTAPSHRTCSDANLPNPRGIYGLVCFPNNYVVTSRDQAWPQEQPGKPPTMPRWCKWWWFVATQIPTSQIGPDWSLVLKNNSLKRTYHFGRLSDFGEAYFFGVNC